MVVRTLSHSPKVHFGLSDITDITNMTSNDSIAWKICAVEMRCRDICCKILHLAKVTSDLFKPLVAAMLWDHEPAEHIN